MHYRADTGAQMNQAGIRVTFQSRNQENLVRRLCEIDNRKFLHEQYFRLFKDLQR